MRGVCMACVPFLFVVRVIVVCLSLDIALPVVCLFMCFSNGACVLTQHKHKHSEMNGACCS